MNRSEHLHFNPWLALVVVCLGQFMVVLDATIVNVALPSIQTDLHISDSSLQWIVNAYTLFFGGFLLLGGRAADLLGRRTLFLAGVALFSVASFLCALATSEAMLIAARALQGLGGALLSPAALAVITSSFDEGPDRTKALSVWAMIASGGSAAGLLLGGTLVEVLSWEWVFIINIPVGVAIAIAALRLVPDSRVDGHRHFDLAGAVSVTGGLVLLVFAIVRAEQWGWGAPRTLAIAATALALLAGFVAIERRSPAPLVRLGLFRLRSLAVANGVFVLVFGGIFSTFFFVTLYLQNVLDFSPLATGFGFLPMTAGIVVGATTAQQLIGRVGVRPVLLSGMTLLGAGLAVLAMTTQVDGSYLGTVAGLVPVAVGMGLTFVPLTLVATTNVDRDDAGLASGVFNTSQQVGGALGLAVLSTLASDRAAHLLGELGGPASAADAAAALVSGFRLAFVVAVGMVAVGLVVASLLLRRSDVERIELSEEAEEAVPVMA